MHKKWSAIKKGEAFSHDMSKQLKKQNHNDRTNLHSTLFNGLGLDATFGTQDATDFKECGTHGILGTLAIIIVNTNH
jgi:hypothetical protein